MVPLTAASKVAVSVGIGGEDDPESLFFGTLLLEVPFAPHHVLAEHGELSLNPRTLKLQAISHLALLVEYYDFVFLFCFLAIKGFLTSNSRTRKVQARIPPQCPGGAR